MTTNEHPQPPTSCTAKPAAAVPFDEARGTLWKTTVWALTVAARLREPSGRRVDMADFLASAVTATAANLGSVDQLLAGRSGSWEADLLSQLVTGTGGHDRDDLITRRTEPVVIHLNVARQVEDNAWDHDRDTTPFYEDVEAVDASFPDIEDPDDERAWQAAVDAVTAKWTARYTAYADAFTAAVHTAAAQLPGLRVPVIVHTVTDPDAPTSGGPAHPDYDAGDLLAHRLWLAAYNAVPLPTGLDESTDGHRPEPAGHVAGEGA